MHKRLRGAARGVFGRFVQALINPLLRGFFDLGGGCCSRTKYLVYCHICTGPCSWGTSAIHRYLDSIVLDRNKHSCIRQFSGVIGYSCASDTVI